MQKEIEGGGTCGKSSRNLGKRLVLPTSPPPDFISCGISMPPKMKKKGGGSKKEIDPNFGTCKKKLKMKFLYLPPPPNFIFKPGVMVKSCAAWLPSAWWRRWRTRPGSSLLPFNLAWPSPAGLRRRCMRPGAGMTETRGERAKFLLNSTSRMPSTWFPDRSSSTLRHPASQFSLAGWCYQQHSELHFGTQHLLSAGGVQQGDPLGPLLFACALHPLALELRGRPLDLAFFYLDDDVIAGDVHAIGVALAHIHIYLFNIIIPKLKKYIIKFLLIKNII